MQCMCVCLWMDTDCRDGASSILRTGDSSAVTGDVAFGPTSIAGALLGLSAIPADMTDARAVVAL